MRQTQQWKTSILCISYSGIQNKMNLKTQKGMVVTRGWEMGEWNRWCLRIYVGFPDSWAGKRICLQCRGPWFNSWVGKIPWRRDRLPTPVFLGFPCGSAGIKDLPAMQETWVQSLGWEDPLEKGTATHSSILVWRIPAVKFLVSTKPDYSMTAKTAIVLVLVNMQTSI